MRGSSAPSSCCASRRARYRNAGHVPGDPAPGRRRRSPGPSRRACPARAHGHDDTAGASPKTRSPSSRVAVAGESPHRRTHQAQAARAHPGQSAVRASGAGAHRPAQRSLVRRRRSGAGLPPAIQQVIRERLSHLPGATRSALSVAAVVGKRFDAPLLAELMERPLEQLLDALDPALRRAWSIRRPAHSRSSASPMCSRVTASTRIWACANAERCTARSHAYSRGEVARVRGSSVP